MYELIDYPEEAAVPSVLNSPIYLPPEGIRNAHYGHSRTLDPSITVSVTNVQSHQDNRGFDINPNLSTVNQKKILSVLEKHEHVFTSSLNQIKTLNTAPYTISLKDNVKPLRSQPYIIPHDAQEWLKGTLEELLNTRKIERSSIDNDWASPAILIPSDIDKRHKKRKRPVKGVAPLYQYAKKSDTATSEKKKKLVGKSSLQY